MCKEGLYNFVGIIEERMSDKELLNTYQGQKVVVGTHGAIMTLMMGIMTVSMI